MAATVSINEVLRQEVLEYLGGAEAVLVKTIMDLSPFVTIGADRVTIPNVLNLNKGDITSGSRAAGSTRETASSVLLLNQAKRVWDYISYKEGKQSALDLKASFLANAPKEYAKLIEDAIATSLLTANAADFNSGTNGKFLVSDISKAKKLMDQAKIPASDRYMAVNAEGMEILAGFDIFEEGQKSLSPEALRQGVVSIVKGFKVVQQENTGFGTAATLKVVFYHKSAVAYAPQSEMEYVEQMDQTYAEEFVALQGLFGCTDVDNAANAGVRKIVMSCKTA